MMTIAPVNPMQAAFDYLRRHARMLRRQANLGDTLAIQILRNYRLHVTCLDEDAGEMLNDLIQVHRERSRR